MDLTASEFESKLANADTFSDVFALVKEITFKFLGKEQAGIMVGLSDLGLRSDGFIGAYYMPNANTIIVNKRPLWQLHQRKPKMYRYYVFHVLLHEYIHSLGSYDEKETRLMVYEISRKYFGDSHVLSQLAMDLNKFTSEFAEPGQNFAPIEEGIDFVKGIDRKNMDYIG